MAFSDGITGLDVVQAGVSHALGILLCSELGSAMARFHACLVGWGLIGVVARHHGVGWLDDGEIDQRKVRRGAAICNREDWVSGRAWVWALSCWCCCL
jgi:hypothetical protein